MFRALLVVLPAGLALVLGEVGLRVFYSIDYARGGDLQRRLERSSRTPPGRRTGPFDISGLVQPSVHRDIVYELKPNLRGTFRGRPITSNSHGMRGDEVTLRKPDGVFRIAGLGDSVMFGWGVCDDETYLEVLERELNAVPDDPRVFECLNFAVPGYNTAMEVAVFERRALAFDPDLVILQVINNDFGLPFFMEHAGKDGLSTGESYVMEFLRKRVAWMRGDLEPHLVGHRFRGFDREEAARIQKPYAYMTGASGFLRAMDRLAGATGHAPTGLADREGSAARRIPVIVMIGTLHASQRNAVNEAVRRHGFVLLDIAPYTQERLTALGVPNTREAYGRVLWIGKGDRHPNPYAHTIYAGGLLRTMADMGIVAPGSEPRLSATYPAPPGFADLEATGVER